MPAAKSYRIGLLCVTLSAIAWSLGGLFTRVLTLDAATMLVWRCLWGAAGMIVLVFLLEGRKAFRAFHGFLKRDAWPAWLFAGLSGFGMICFIASLRTTTVAHVSVIYAAVPFAAAGIAWVAIGERPSATAILASIAALVGVAVMVGLSTDGGLIGDLLACGMMLSMAVSMVLARKYPEIPFMPAAIASALLATLACLPFADPLNVTARDMGILALFGIVNSALGLGLFTLGARFVPAIETALIGALDAPLSPFWVWLVFSEVPDSGTIIGGFIVFVAVGMHIILSARQTRAIEATG